jgi:predicted molibdopterin-dependent oxidoreductase YjgC
MPACCGMAVQRSENQAASPAATVTVCPCNALMEKSMLGHGGFFDVSQEVGA